MSRSVRRFGNLVILTLAVTFAKAASPVPHTTWELLAPPASPPPRSYFAMAYDPVSRKVVLFGGYDGSEYLNDTWTFDGATWIQVETAVSPKARSSVSMTFDARSNKLVLFGGFAGGQGFLNDTWLWDGTTSTWTQVEMKYSPPKASGPMLFTDPKSGRAIMFGGGNRSAPFKYFDTTWRWSGAYWQKLLPSTIPYARAGGVAILDRAKHLAVLTGGESELVRTDNTWIWDGNDWAQDFPPTQIPATIGSGAAFDSTFQSVLVFGGFDLMETNGTWSWSGTDWAQLKPTQAPSPREGVGMAYDSDSGQTLIFGGLDANGNVLNDTWQLIVQ